MPYYPERKPDPYAEEQKRIAEAAAKGKRRRLALAVVFALIIVYSLIRLIAYGVEYFSSRETSQALYELYEEPTEVIAAVPTAVPTAVPVTEVPVQAMSIPEPTQSVYLPPVPYPDNPDWKISERFRKLKKRPLTKLKLFIDNFINEEVLTIGFSKSTPLDHEHRLGTHHSGSPAGTVPSLGQDRRQSGLR